MVNLDSSHNPLHILVVDGNTAEREASLATLKSYGHIGDEAASGEEALEKALYIPFDLILMELHFPNLDALHQAEPRLDGFATAARIQEYNATRGLVPIIGLSATKDPADVRRCFEISMSNFIPKPLTGSQLFAIAYSYSQRKAHLLPKVSRLHPSAGLF